MTIIGPPFKPRRIRPVDLEEAGARVTWTSRANKGAVKALLR